MRTKSCLKLLAALLYLLPVLTACNQDQDQKLTSETLCGKWNVSGTSAYKSFEFNKSENFLVVKQSGDDLSTVFGTYQISGSQKVALSGLGTIELTTIDGSQFDFSFKPDSSSETLNFKTTKSAVMAASSKTDLFCRTWDMYSINGERVAGTHLEATVLFSDAGTYYVNFVNPDEANEDGLSTWTWKDADETVICYSWEGNPTCDGENEVQVLKLTADSLVLEEQDEIYRLVPVASTKSSVLKSGGVYSQRKIQQGFLRK